LLWKGCELWRDAPNRAVKDLSPDFFLNRKIYNIQYTIYKQKCTGKTEPSQKQMKKNLTF
jgi:hypothetical protein